VNKELLFFQTDNTALAFALRNAGVPWKNPADPCWNVYTPEMLASYGVKTIEEAVAKGKPGKVTYFLEYADNLDALKKAWGEQVEESEKIEGGASSTREIDVEPEDVIRIAAHLLKGYAKFKTLWREVPPKLYVRNQGKVRKSRRPDGSTVYKHPGARIASANTPKEDLKRLKLL